MPPPAETETTSNQYIELAELAGRLIHEIKNHLGTLSLNLQILAEDLQIPETPRERRTGQRVQKLLNECQRLADLSADPVGGTVPETAAFMRAEVERWNNVIKAANVKLE